MSRPAVLAIDGGGSKIDAVLIDRDGALAGSARVEPSDTDGQRAGDQAAIGLAVEAACRDARIDTDDLPVARLGVFCLAGADLAADDRRILRSLEHRWTTDTILRNDTFAVLRAGTNRTWGVGVVCGFGTNCSAVAPDGRTYRFPALGWIAGDWGGGADIGEAAIWHSVRSEDGRGERTSLASAVPAYFDLRRPKQVMEAMYFGRLSVSRIAELPPLVFEAAADGDAVARSIVDRQADEVVSMATAAIRRLRMTALDVHVVLGGGIFRNTFEPFLERVDDGIHRSAPAATVTVLGAPPVVGAALLGLDRLRASRAAKDRLRTALTKDPLGNRLDGKRRR